MKPLNLVPLACGVVVTCAAPGVAANPFGWHEHDGFYLRLSLGASVLNVERDTRSEGQPASVLFLGDHSRVGNVAGFVELSIGGTPFDRVAIVGTVLSYSIQNADLDLVDGTSAPLDANLGLTVLAPQVDIFPDPSGGFHFGGGFGLALIEASTALDPGHVGGTGGAATANAGYGWWIHDDWTVGADLRGTLGYVRGDWRSADFVGREKDLVTALSLAVTVLYH